MKRLLPLVLLMTGTLADGETPLTVRVLSYNIHHGEGTDWRVDLVRLGGVIRRLDPDLVSLQEVDVDTARSGGINQVAELARQTAMHAEFGKAMDFDGGSYGVAVLSRWPLMPVAAHPLPHAPGREPRTALTVRVRPVPHRSWLRFTSTHLDQGRDPRTRIAQAEALALLLAGDETPSILAGDLNTRQDADVLRILASWTNAAPADSDPAIVMQPRAGADHVLFRPAASWRVIDWHLVDDTLTSDHRPLLVVLESTGPRSGRARPCRSRIVRPAPLRLKGSGNAVG
jgi:endonuclease/exonuclease/phosphatase family metal-dependent hydrolase